MDMLNIQVRQVQAKSGPISILILSGALDAHTAPDLENQVAALLKGVTKRFLVILKDLEYISSVGIGTFIGFQHDIKAKSGELAFAAMNDKVKKVFEMSGFLRLVKAYADEGQAAEFLTR